MLELEMAMVKLRTVNLVGQHIQDFSDVFTNVLGDHNAVAKIFVKEGTIPKRYKARRVPFPLRKPVKEEIRHLEREGTN